MNSFNII